MSDQTPTEPTTQPTVEPPTRRRGFHPVTVGHLVMGLIFLCVVVLWIVLQSGGIDLHDLRWAIPFPFLVAGAIGLVAAAITARRQHSR